MDCWALPKQKCNSTGKKPFKRGCINWTEFGLSKV